MAIIQISKMQQRSGNIVDLPQLDEAELGFATDDKRLFIGKETPAENIEVLTSYSEIAFDQIAGSQGNLDISSNVANGQTLVYDGNNWVNRGGDAGGLITLGDVSNIKITGGAIGYVLETDGIGNLSWTPKSTIIAFVENVTQADPAVVTTTEDNFFTNGAEVTITNVPGMTQLNGNSYYVDVLSSNTFALYTSSNLDPLYSLDSTGYNAFPYTSATATTSGTNEVSVVDANAFVQDDPIIFIGDTANSLILAGQVYFIANIISSNTFTISETEGGSEKTLATDTISANVYVPGGRVISLVGGAGGAAAGGSSETVQYNKTGILTGDAAFTFNDTSKLLTLNGTANLSNLNVGNLNTTSTITAPQFISTIVTGTAPLVVNSTTLVANLAAATAVVSTSSNVAQTVSNAAQPNITSLGTLTGLTVSNTSSINGITIVGGSNVGAHVSVFTNNLAGDNGIQFTVYGNSYASGSLFGVGANGSAVSANTSAPFGIGTRSSQPLVLGVNGAEKVRITSNGNVGINTTSTRGNLSIGRDSTGSTESHILHFGYTPADYYGFRFNNTNNPAVTAAGNLVIQRGVVSGWTDVVTIDNVGAVTVQTPGSGNALTISGATVSTSIVTTNITTGANTIAGTVTGNWTLTAGSKLQSTYADLAEYYLADAYYIPGTVLEFGGNNEVTEATEYTNRVAGVVTTNPAYVMNSTCDGQYPVILALQGRVPCKVKGSVKKGDMMVSAGKGYARSEPNPSVGTVIGKAIKDFNGEEGVIEVAVGRY